MADLGSILRETRIRAKIDITTVEQATKIRAKYLRALENEEWGILPGPAYVKSFLRTYAEYLGLDAHMLVEEYRARFEEPEDLELPAFAAERPLRGRVRAPGPPSRGVVVAVVAVALIALLFVLGVTSGNDNGDSRTASTGRGGKTTSRAAGGRSRSSASHGPVRLAVLASRNVWVCVVDAKGRLRVPGQTLVAGDREGPFRSERFELTVGNGGADLAVNGKRRDLPETATPQGYVVTTARTRELSASRRPTCEGGGAGGRGAASGARTG
jgi:cytoskeleton protein RodZ